MNKDSFFNSNMTEILRQMQENKRNISLPDDEIFSQAEQIKQNLSSAAEELSHQKEERLGGILNNALGNNFTKAERTGELLNPFQAETRHLLSSSLSPIFEGYSKALLNFREHLGKTMLPDISSARSAAIESIKEQTGKYTGSIVGNLMESVQFNDLSKLTRFDAAKIFEGVGVSAFLPNQKDLISSIAALQPAWRGSGIAYDSIEGMTGLMSLRNAVVANPFGDLERNAFQSLLGSWDSTKLTKSVLFDADARRAFYLEQGFDARLTAFSSGTYNDALFQSGLLRPDLFSPAFPSSEMGYYPLEEDERKTEDSSELEEKKEYKARLLKAYDIISNLEIRLREFLIEEMEKLFGQSWIKQRVPGEIHGQWKQKRDSAVKKGEEEQPIIWYADFTDYEKIITRKDNWKDTFEGKFINVMDVQISFQRLYPIRNCTMHTRPLTKEDFLLLTVEAQRILRAIGGIDRQDEG